MNDLKVTPKYNKTDLIHTEFFNIPSTSCQDVICLKTIDTSSNISYPSKRYDFVRKIIDGSTSIIYCGKDLIKNENVVIKMIPKKDKWRTELAILKEFVNSDSGRILKFIDYFESQRNSYIVTEFYDGFDLFGHVDINIPYSEDKSMKILKEMALCVKECHERFIIHLDIKCENFMVRKQCLFENGEVEPGNIVLIDFGHSEIVEGDVNKLRPGEGHGTTFFLCPEGYNKMISGKSDIWALGICFSLLTTGDFPFVGNEREFMYNAIKHNIKLTKKISKKASDIISFCLGVLPENRPTIDELINLVSA